MWSTAGLLLAGRIRCFFWKSLHPNTCQSLYRAMEWDTSDPTLQVCNGLEIFLFMVQIAVTRVLGSEAIHW